jgi:hypothetical protein
METCQECGKQDETVSTVDCGFAEEIYGELVEETICDDCEHEHLMDI